MKLFRMVIAIAVTSLAACSSWSSGSKKPSAHMYDGDSSPVIKMYDESPGSPLHN